MRRPPSFDCCPVRQVAVGKDAGGADSEPFLQAADGPIRGVRRRKAPTGNMLLALRMKVLPFPCLLAPAMEGKRVRVKGWHAQPARWGPSSIEDFVLGPVLDAPPTGGPPSSSLGSGCRSG